MTSEQIRTFLDRHMRTWERQDVAALVADYTDDAEITSPLFHTISGRKQIESSWRELFLALADFKFEINDIVIDRDADKAVMLYTGNSTQHGEFMGMPASGRRSQNRGAFLFTFRDGRIATETRLYDFTGMLLQLGVIKTRAM
jgi:steroid delta-isomerase-like uncharacterized protein